MLKNIADALADSINEVLSAMASMQALSVTARDLNLGEDPMLYAHIHFTGEHDGEIGLLFDPGLAPHITARILGFDSPEMLLDDMIEDGVKEVLNVVCGHFLTKVFGDKPVYSLGMPAFFTMNSVACHALLCNPGTVAFTVETYPVLGFARIKQS